MDYIGMCFSAVLVILTILVINKEGMVCTLVLICFKKELFFHH